MGQVGLGYGGYVRVNEAGSGWVNWTPISKDTWYYLDVQLPQGSSPSPHTTVTLYQRDGTTQIATVTYGTDGPAYAYQYFGLANSYLGPAYFDNFTIVPEPATSAVTTGTALGLWLLLRRNRK